MNTTLSNRKEAFFLILFLLISISWKNAEKPKENKSEVLKGTIIIPASDFLDEIPKGNTITDAKSERVDWLFNNTAIVLDSKTNLLVKVTVHEDGNYFLYVRSKSRKGGSFKVVVNDQVTTMSFGKVPLSWQKGDDFQLKKGKIDVKITRIEQGSIFDVLVLSKNPDLKEEDIMPYQLNEEVKLLKSYQIPPSNAVKFGDVNGDGLTDFMALEGDFSAHVFDNSGKELWQWKAPEKDGVKRSEFEAPGLLWDFDQDGKAEVVHWRMEEGKEKLVIASGETGKVLREVDWPTQPLPHEYNNFRLAIAKLTKGAPNEIIAFTDMGGTINITAYSADLKQLWQHTEKRKKDNLGHYAYPIDLNKDGIDEVLIGSLLLDANGKELWNKFDLLPDNHDHADSYKFLDLNGDGKLEIITANSEAGVFVYEAMTGKIIWENVAEHSQQIQAGNFLEKGSGPQVVVGGRTYGNRSIGEPYLSSQLYWFDKNGNHLFKWPSAPINGNPDFVKGDWLGNGVEQLFWYKFEINKQGKGELYFPDPVFHMFDFMGKGAEEVITLNRGVLQIYGSNKAQHKGIDHKKDLMYLKNIVVNHTHY
ncbi:MAG: hypothetical protein ABIP95_03650 [Pelobium sp.]